MYCRISQKFGLCGSGWASGGILGCEALYQKRAISRKINLMVDASKSGLVYKSNFKQCC